MATIWDKWNAIPGWDQVQKTQQYLSSTPLFQQHVHDILFKYGVDPGNQAGMAGTSVDFSNDPYSVVNLLKGSHQTADQGTFNQVNAAGLESSGAAIGALNANNEDYKKNYALALQQMGQELSGEFGNYTNTIGGIFDNLEQAPAAPAPAAAPVNYGSAAQIAAGTGPGAAVPTPQTGYQRTGPEAGGTVVKKLLAPKTIKPGTFGGMGRIT